MIKLFQHYVINQADKTIEWIFLKKTQLNLVIKILEFWNINLFLLR